MKGDLPTSCRECGTDLESGDGQTCSACGTTVYVPDGGTPTGDRWSGPGGGSVSGSPGGGDRGGDSPIHRRGLVGFSLTYPFAGGIGKLLLSMLLLVGAILIVPLFFLYGYGVRLGRGAMRGDPQPPKYEDWGGLFVDGVLSIVVGLPFTLPVLALFWIAVLQELYWLAAVVYIVLAFVGGAIYPTFLATGSVRGTYSNLRFLRFAATVDYLKGLLAVVVLTFGVVMAFIVALFALLLVMGIAGFAATSLGGDLVGGLFSLGSFLLFIPMYLGLAVYVAFLNHSVWGHVYYTAAKKGKVPPVSNPDTLRTRF